MLIDNPFNYLLYEYGYDGRENIYKYWMENKVELLKFFHKNAQILLKKTNYLEEFELKVRWSSPMGVLIKFDICNFIRESSPGTIIDFNKFKVRYGDKLYSLDDFYELHPYKGVNVSEGNVDLRGVSIINSHIKDVTFQNVDFRCSSLDSTTFANVRFNQCNMDHVRLCRAELIDCIFDNKSSLNYIDFSDAYVRAVFNVSVCEPYFTKFYKSDLLGILMRKGLPWRTYTEVWGRSFPEHCRRKKDSEYFFRLEKVLEEAYKLRNAHVMYKLFFMLQQIFKPL